MKGRCRHLPRCSRMSILRSVWFTVVTNWSTSDFLETSVGTAIESRPISLISSATFLSVLVCDLTPRRLRLDACEFERYASHTGAATGDKRLAARDSFACFDSHVKILFSCFIQAVSEGVAVFKAFDKINTRARPITNNLLCSL